MPNAPIFLRFCPFFARFGAKRQQKMSAMGRSLSQPSHEGKGAGNPIERGGSR